MSELYIPVERPTRNPINGRFLKGIAPHNKGKTMKRCREDMIFDTIVFILLTVILIVVAYPLYWVIISSISAPSAVSGGRVLWKPVGFTMKGYMEVFKNSAV